MYFPLTLSLLCLLFSPFIRMARARERTAPLKLTEKAAARVKELIAGRGTPTHGVRLGVRSRGCNGMLLKGFFHVCVLRHGRWVLWSGVSTFMLVL